MIERDSTSMDLVNVLNYNSKFIQLAYPNESLSDPEVQQVQSWVLEKNDQSIQLIKQFEDLGVEPDVSQKHFLAMYIKELFESQGQTPKTGQQLLSEDEENKKKEEVYFEPLIYAKSTTNPLGSSLNHPDSPFSSTNLNNKQKIEPGVGKDQPLTNNPIEQQSEQDLNEREKVAYTNWYAGNVDPEELHKHKELLDRQYFGGPTWDGVEKPKSIMNDGEQFKGYMETLYIA